MEKSTQVLLTISVLIGLVMGLYVFSDWFSKTTGYTLGEDQKIHFAECLKEQGTTLYITQDCWDCEQQQDLLGATVFVYVPIITCGEDLCQGLEKVPAWGINGTFYYGKKTFQELDQLSSCDIPQ